MTDVALISELSHYKLKAQKDEFPDMPHFRVPEDVSTLLRPSQRQGALRVNVLSLAIMADNKEDFIELLALLKKRKVKLITKKEGFTWSGNVPHIVDEWKLARKRGAAKAGGDAKSDNSLLRFWEGFSKIKDRWHLDENSKVLMKEAGIKHHDTVRANLGHTRWEWRSFSDAKRARVLKQLEKEVRECQKKQ